MSRLRPLVIAALTVIASLAVFNLLAATVGGQYPKGIWIHQWLDPFERDRTASKVAALERVLRTTPSPDAPPVAGIVLGLSTAREGIDPMALRKRVHSVDLIANFASSGGSFQELLYYSEPIFRSSTKPVFALVGIHPAWLAGRRPAPPPSWHFVQQDKLEIGREIWQSIWILENRLRIRNATLNMLLEFRYELQGFLGAQPVPAVSLPIIDLDAVEHLYSGSKAPESFIATQTRAFEQMGWFSAEAYNQPDAEVAALRDLLVRLHGITANTIVVIMPESSSFRSRVPKEAQEIVGRCVAEVPGTRILDLRNALEEDAFYDLVHPNAEGRSTIIERISAAIPAARPSATDTFQ